ncbi:MAG: hypothetical protein ACXVA9_06120 [Bdellovibrionales bacterium]
MKYLSAIAILFLSLTACQVIRIHNVKQPVLDETSARAVVYPQDEWHHIGIFQLAEFSDSVDLSKRCAGKEWTTVRTRRSPGQVALGFVPYLSYAWSPLEVAYACK